MNWKLIVKIRYGRLYREIQIEIQSIQSGFLKYKMCVGNQVVSKHGCALEAFFNEKVLTYSETLAPVVRYDSLRVLLAMVAQKDLELTQFDVKTAFLNGKLKEEIYMEAPEGLVITDDPAKVVCKLLQSSLYGLKQAPRSWSDIFREFLK